MFREWFLIFCGLSFGVLSAAGVFTVFSTVGLVPRFAGKTHSANEILLYENMIVAGTLFGNLLSIWPDSCEQFVLRMETVARIPIFWSGFQYSGLIVYGLFSGMFVGCFALSIAEMLDSIPIFTRRVSFQKGIGLAICSVAAGKLSGSLFYFLGEISK